MELTLKELNEIYYCLSKVLNLDGPSLADKEAITKLKTKIWDEIDMIEYESQSNDDDEDLGPEYDSAGFTEDDRIVNGQYRVVNNKDKDDWLENRLSEDSFPHYVTNEEADEDYKASLMQDEQRYNNQHK